MSNSQTTYRILEKLHGKFYSEKADESSPLIRSCFFCCSLTIGLMCSILIFIIFDLIFLIKKSKFMIDADFTYRLAGFLILFRYCLHLTFRGLEKKLAAIDMAIVIITTITSFFMIISTCLFAVPEKHSSMKKMSIIWVRIKSMTFDRP